MKGPNTEYVIHSPIVVNGPSIVPTDKKMLSLVMMPSNASSFSCDESLYNHPSANENYLNNVYTSKNQLQNSTNNMNNGIISIPNNYTTSSIPSNNATTITSSTEVFLQNITTTNGQNQTTTTTSSSGDDIVSRPVTLEVMSTVAIPHESTSTSTTTIVSPSMSQPSRVVVVGSNSEPSSPINPVAQFNMELMKATTPQLLSFCQMLQEHNYSTRNSMKMLVILELANKLVVLVNSKNVFQFKEFIRNDIKDHGVALYGHVGGGPKLIREVINYIGSKRTKRKFMPLTTACIIGCLSMVKFLMKNGANQYQKCLDELPVETAQRYGHKEIVRFLRDFSLDTCHKNRKIRKHFKHTLNNQNGLMSNCLHDISFTFTN